MLILKRYLLRAMRTLIAAAFLVTLLSACGGGGSDNDDSDTGAVIDDGDNGGDNGGDAPGGDNDDDTGDNTDDGSGDDGTDDDGDDDDTINAPRAVAVIGQRDFSGSAMHQGGSGPDANTLNMPMGPAAWAPDQEILFIADSDDARVLAFQGIPDVNGKNADFVLGQVDFTSAVKATTAEGMLTPQNLTTTGGRLIITDNDGNRVLVHDDIPVAGDALPDVVVGQDSMDAREGSCDADSLIHPHGHFLTPGGRFLVADSANNRVLIWNSLPTENGAPADLVLGQGSFTNCSFRGDENFKHPTSIWTDDEKLIVVDSEKHRILIWNEFPTTDFERPDVIVGQTDVFHVAPNDKDQDGVTDDDGTANAHVMSYPRGVWVEDGRMYVADMDNHRVLAWNTIPAATFTPADHVIGQQNFTDNHPNAGQAAPNEYGFQRPVGVSVIGGQLFVTDWENSRVMIFEEP